MSEVKWIKITIDMFSNRKITHLRKLPDGNNIVLIWVMLLTMAGRCNAGGMIFLTENIPYTAKMLADELDFEESTISLALEAMERLNMISRDDGCFRIAGWDEYQNIDKLSEIREYNRAAKQKSRLKQTLSSNVNDMSMTCQPCQSTDRERDKEVDRDREVDKEKKTTTTHNAREALGSETEAGAEERGLDPALGEVMSAYLDKLGCYLSSTALGELKGYYDSWGKDVLLHALNVATDAGKLNWAYIRAILRGYAHDGVKTLNDVQRLETEYADAKRRKEARNGTAGRITPRDSGESDSRWGIVPTVDGTV